LRFEWKLAVAIIILIVAIIVVIMLIDEDAKGKTLIFSAMLGEMRKKYR
jgi:hypothetical protein